MEDNLYKEFGKRLANIRKAANLTQSEVAKKLNTVQSTYSAYELGTRKITIELITALSKIFNVSPDYLITGKENLSSLQNFYPDETDIIKKYRLLDDRGKTTVRETVNREYSYVTQNKTIELSDVKKTGKTQTVRIASRNGPSTLTLNEEQLKAARELVKKLQENPDDDIDDDLV